jgi:Lsr2
MAKDGFNDDIDRTAADRTVRFGLHGVDYEIDLNATHAKDLQDALKKYVEAGRPFGGGAQDPSHYEAAYSVLSDRISDNFDLQWRGPTFALTAQAFLFIGFLTATSNHVIQAVLAILIIVVGVAAALLMARVQCLIAIDQALLDKYGQKLLGNNSDLLLQHAQRVKLRAEKTHYRIRWHTRVLLIMTPTPIMLWIITLLALSGAGGYLLWALHFKYIT